MSNYEESEIEASFDYCGNFMNVSKARDELAQLRARAAKADEWRKKYERIAIHTGFAEIPAGQGHVISADPETICNFIDEVVAEADALLATVAQHAAQLEQAHELLTTLDWNDWDDRVDAWLAEYAKTQKAADNA